MSPPVRVHGHRAAASSQSPPPDKTVSSSCQSSTVESSALSQSSGYYSSPSCRCPAILGLRSFVFRSPGGRRGVVSVLPHKERALQRNCHLVDRVEAFFHRRSLHLPNRACDCGNRDPLLSRALLVARNRIGQRSLKEVRDDAKSGIPGRADVSGAVAG